VIGYGQGGNVDLTYQAVEDGWYLCWGTFNGAASSSTHGVVVKAGRTIIIDDVQLALQGANFSSVQPFCAGYKIGCSWSGAAHNSSSSRPLALLQMSLDDEMSGEFGLGFWLAPQWASDEATDDIGIVFRGVSYIGPPFDTTQLTWDYANTRFVLERINNGTNVATINGSSQAFDYGDWVHIAIVQTATTLYLYINGLEDGSASIKAGAQDGGIFQLSSSQIGDPSINGLLDGLRLFSTPPSATEIANLFASEQPIKAAGKLIGVPLFLWTKDGDGDFEAVDGTVFGVEKNHWGIVGVSGEIEALCEWQIKPPTSSPSRVYWLGRIAADEAFTPSGVVWLEYIGNAAVGSASDDAYESDTGSGDNDFDAVLTKVLPGCYEFFARFKATTNAVIIKPFYRLGSGDPVEGDGISIPTNANFLFRDVGELALPEGAPGTTYTAGIRVERNGTATAQIDFIMLMPTNHSCRVEAEQASLTIASGDIIVIAGRSALALDASDDYSQLQKFHFEGNPVTVVPHKYNHIFLLQGEEGEQYDVTDVATVEMFATPRYLLPGGAVG
jgi:hypothetical protein